MTIFTETFGRTNEIVTRAMRYAMGKKIMGPEDKPKKQYVEFADNAEEWDLAAEKEILVALLRNYRQQVDKKYLPDFYTTIDRMGYDAYVYALYTSRLKSS